MTSPLGVQKHNLELFLLCLKLLLYPGINTHSLYIVYFILKTAMHYVSGAEVPLLPKVLFLCASSVHTK